VSVQNHQFNLTQSHLIATTSLHGLSIPVCISGGPMTSRHLNMCRLMIQPVI
jgi:hypothetical protein